MRCVHCLHDDGPRLRRTGALLAFLGGVAVTGLALRAYEHAGVAPCRNYTQPLARPMAAPAPVVEPLPQPAGPATPSSPGAMDPQGSQAQVRWGPHWYAGSVRGAVCEGFVRVRFDGYGDEWEEVVTEADVRPRGTATEARSTRVGRRPIPSSRTLSRGMRVMVEWGGSHYAARVLRVDADGRARIRYDGYDASSDEVVGRERIFDREANAGEPRPAAVSTPTGAPVGASDAMPIGTRLEVRDGPNWYRARVVGHGCAGLVNVAYDGWDSDWNAWVPRDRIRVLR